MRHEPHERALSLRHGAVAGHCAVDLALNLERHLATVAASFVVHELTPCLDAEAEIVLMGIGSG